MEYKIIVDGARHMVTLPYTEENLHKAAQQLGIKRCWFHGGTKPHYDVPLRLHESGTLYKFVDKVVTKRELLRVVIGVIKEFEALN